MNKKNVNIIRGTEFIQFIILTILLFAFWLVMSGQFKPDLLLIGFTTSAIAAWITRPLMRMPSLKNPDKAYLAFYIPYFKLLLYWIWLFKEIVKANIYVIKLVLNPKMPIDPAVVTFKKRMDNPLSHFTLANSITLTPGTVTIAIEDDIYYVHAITKEVGSDLALPDGQDAEMTKRVAALFEGR